MSDVLEAAAEQPYGVEIRMADGIFIKQITVPKAMTLVPQHSHTYDHTSMIAVGSFRVWKNGELLGDVTAPTGLMIEAGAKHAFLSLTDGATIYCIHNISRTGEMEIQEEHQIVGKARPSWV
jgi:quercetin dioxygenase-like cupin family protein